MIAPTPFFSDRGTHIRIFEEAKGLAKRGHMVDIVTYHLGDNPFEGETVIIHHIPRLLFWYSKREAGASWQKILLDILLILKTLLVARRVRPDILHGHLHEGMLIGWIVKKLLFRQKMKLAGDFHSTLTAEMVADSYLLWKPMRRLFQALEDGITFLPDVCITSAETLAQTLRQKRKNVVAVLDGIDPSRYENLPREEESRKKCDLPPYTPIVIYAGSLVSYKGIDLLYSALQEAAKQTTDVHFVLGGFPRTGAEQFVRKHDLSSRVTIISPLAYDDLPLLLSAATIGIDPKHDVGVGQASGKILQYMAAGLPVVCFDTPANRAYLGEGGIYVPRATPEEFAQAILNLLQDPKKIQRLGNINRERIRLFSSDAAAEKIEAIYQEIASASRKAQSTSQ